MAKKLKHEPIKVDSSALRRRIRGFYARMNSQQWNRCFAHLDPRLRAAGKITSTHYMRSLAEFQQRYGLIDIWYLRASTHGGALAASDQRPFAYVYILWQDTHKQLHLFRERWVRDQGRWYTRVVGLVAHDRGNDTGT
jgi:hypothetical protein